MHVQCQPISGYLDGAISPSVLLHFDGHAFAQSSVESALMALLVACSDTAIERTAIQGDSGTPIPPTIRLWIRVLDALMCTLGDQRFTPIRMVRTHHPLSCSFPTLATAAVLLTVKRLGQWITEGSRASDLPSDHAHRRWIERLCAEARPHFPGGTNTGNFIQAAAAHRLPFQLWSNRYLMLGYGSGSTVLNSSITETESAVGVGLAKSKVVTNRLLRLSGFPVPEQTRVASLAAAQQAAARIGYPVVLKPELEEQGRGVHADIRNEQELTDCYNDSAPRYGSMLVEKQIPGDHYRIDFMGDQLIKAVRRLPARVTGDGQSTVEALIHRLNQDPRRNHRHSSMKPVQIDQDVHTTLAKQGVDLRQILPPGHTVSLRSISNLSRGGDQTDARALVHPDNYRLVRDVANTMGLSVLGVDFISPDASVPWRKNGAAICEVNAQPQLGVQHTPIYWDFIARLIGPQPTIHLTVTDESARQSTPLFDRRLETLSLSVRASTILREGAPCQYFQHLTIDQTLPEALRAHIQARVISTPPDPLKEHP